MTLCKVGVKWGKEKFPDIELNPEEPPLLFKAQLFQITGVEPDRQKVMFKGKVLGDDSWTDFPPLKDGALLMMMGSADAVPQAPTKKTVFMEDMSEGELNKALALPAGLKNLGNTCYLNATIQCLKTVPELCSALQDYSGNLLAVSVDNIDSSKAVTTALRDLYRSMDSSERSEVVPMIMVQIMHMAFPRFAETGENGAPMQQDANECWVEIVRMLQQQLKLPAGHDSAGPSGASSSSPNPSVVSRYFGGTFEKSLKCVEAPDEPETQSTEDFLQLSCFLSVEVKYMHTGLKARLSDEITKRSPTLDRDAIYQQKSVISRLPAYLTVSFVRFFYKENSATNAKILKDVKFPVNLDVYDLCSPELQKRLLLMRNRFKAADDRAVLAGKVKGAKTEQEPPGKCEYYPTSFEDDLGSNNSGFYELQAVMTHKGRSSNSGHYVGWVRRIAPDGSRKWLMCDDENITVVTEEDVLKLSGGGDWHCAYVLLYGPRRLAIHPENEKEGVKVAEGDVEMKTENGDVGSTI